MIMKKKYRYSNHHSHGKPHGRGNIREEELLMLKLQVGYNYPPTWKSAGLRADYPHWPHSRCIRTGISTAYLIAHAVRILDQEGEDK